MYNWQKITFINIYDKTSKIIVNTQNIITQSNKNIFLLRNLNSINVIALDDKTWLFF